jgi:CRP-like cAMP-binding protein
MNPGEVVCEPRTIDERLVILLDGRLRLESAAGELLDYQTPVRVIGEMGVFTGQIRSTKVVVEDSADILILSADALDDMLEEDPQMGNHMLANLIKLLYSRLYDVNQEMEHLRSTVASLRARVQELSPGDPPLMNYFQNSNSPAETGTGLRDVTSIRRGPFCSGSRENEPRRNAN